MDKKVILWVVLGVLLLLVLFQTFQISIIGKSIAGGTGNAVSNANMPASSAPSAPSSAPSSGGMVGGC